MSPAKKARHVALDAVHATAQQTGSLDTVLSGDSALALSAGELTLARMIASTTVRHWFHLQQILEQLLQRPFKPKDQVLHSLLMTGLAQLAFTRQAEHAVVAETVSLTPELGRPWARGVVNAVLRNFLRDKATFLMEKHDEQAVFNHPAWLIGKLKKAYPEHYQAILNANNQRAPMTLRPNRQQISPEDYLKALHDADIEGQLTPGGAIVLAQPQRVDALPQFAQGAVSVQDSNAQWAAQWLACQPGERVLDACAAPGGKTCHLLELEPGIELIALDSHARRLDRIHQNLERLGLQCDVVCADASQPGPWSQTPFDRILLDAPCSGTGVIRRHPDIRLARTPEQVVETVQIQAQLLDYLWTRVRPGGQLLYVTCSVLPEENHKQIQRFLQATPYAQLAALPNAGDVPAPLGSQFLPGCGDADGFYYASLVKSQPEAGVNS